MQCKQDDKKHKQELVTKMSFILLLLLYLLRFNVNQPVDLWYIISKYYIKH